MNIGEQIKRLRLSKGLEQDVFAKSIGLSRSWLNKIENGKAELSEKTEANIFRTYHVKLGAEKHIDKNTVQDDGGGIVHGQYKTVATKEMLPMQALMEIAASNRILAQAHDKQAEANRQLSEANKVLAENVSKLIENVGPQNFEAFGPRLDALLELLKEVAQGKRYEGTGAVEARYSQIWDTLNKKQKQKNTQTEKDNAGK
jgi:transcriptional regulator with XRE-family HTH domain